jgi:hypothetical protein
LIDSSELLDRLLAELLRCLHASHCTLIVETE